MDKKIQDSMNNLIIKEASLLYDVNFDMIKYIGGFENFVYEFKKNNVLYIMRFVHSEHRTEEQVLAEIEYQEYLYHNFIPVSRVIPSIKDNVVETIMIDEDSCFYITVYKKALGRRVNPEDMTKDFIINFGDLVGKMHQVVKNFDPLYKRIHWYNEPYLRIAKDILKEEDTIIVKKYIKVINKIKALNDDEEHYGIIHTDMHFGNLLYDGEKLEIFDFDDSSYKHFISDIAIIIFYQFAFNDFSKNEITIKSAEFLKYFLQGYRKNKTISEDIIKQLNLFFMLRIINLYIAIHQAGLEEIESTFGKNYIKKYRKLIIEEADFVEIDYIIKNIQ